jgi:hypothetical protein
MLINKISAFTHRPLAWISGMLGMLMCASALSVAPLPAQAKAAPADDRVDNCNWNRPGVNPFMGDVAAAVDRYQDIPGAVRERLKLRMRERNFDEFVTISRDAISGRANYDARISDMHFGTGRVCRQVSRAGWTAQMKERGLVYCEQGHCILVPTVCRNVSRISRAPGSTTAAGGGAAGGASAPSAGGAMPDTVASTPATPFEELRPGSGSLDAQPPMTVAGDTLHLPGMVPGATFGAGASSLGGLSVFSGGSGPASSNTGGGGGSPLSPVPEPETWGMMLAGLACVAFAARRKRPA